MRAYTLGEWRVLIAGAGLSWIVGDDVTHYSTNVKRRSRKVGPDDVTTGATYDLLAGADAHARKIFEIEYEGSRAVRFQMPVALILAVKPAAPEEP